MWYEWQFVVKLTTVLVFTVMGFKGIDDISNQRDLNDRFNILLPHSLANPLPH